jgi:hypothetical protein
VSDASLDFGLTGTSIKEGQPSAKHDMSSDCAAGKDASSLGRGGKPKPGGVVNIRDELNRAIHGEGAVCALRFVLALIGFRIFMLTGF